MYYRERERTFEKDGVLSRKRVYFRERERTFEKEGVLSRKRVYGLGVCLRLSAWRVLQANRI